MTNNINIICTKEGTTCSTEGKRQPQSPFISAVLITIPEAIREPTNHDALNMDVIMALSFGYDY